MSSLMIEITLFLYGVLAIRERGKPVVEDYIASVAIVMVKKKCVISYTYNCLDVLITRVRP